MIGFPNAKINIGLNVVEKRLDGYHNLETIFYPVNIFDSVEILEGKELQFFSYGMEIPGDMESNLCVRAFRLLESEFKIPKVQIHLLKNIPFGAGLGGGSADAAWVLKMLNQKFDLGISTQNLEKYAAELGSDCAFFVRNKPQYASGRGEILESIDIDLHKYTFALIKPNFGISTKDAFLGLKAKPSDHDLRSLVKQPIETWKFQINNDFEESLFPKFPVLGKLKNEIYERGAIYASMSGSGSTLFGIFEPGFKEQFKAPEGSQIFWL